jgi:PLD-like domain
MATRLVDRAWRTELLEGRRRYSDALRVVCPFIKASPLNELLEVARSEPLEVVTRFNLADFGRGVSDIAALRTVLMAGGRVKGVRSLHAKLFLFGDRLAVVTSANLTRQGLDANHEFGCLSDDRSFVVACRAYFDRLWNEAGPALTLEQLDEWDAEVTQFLEAGGRPDREAQLPDHGALVGLRVALLDPGWPAESGHAFVKFFGRTDDRRSWDYDTFAEVRRAGCHWACTYPRDKRPRQVADGDTMFMGRLVKEPNDTLIFGRGIGLAYVDRLDDATPEEIADREWKARWPHYIRVHHAEFVAGHLANGVPLSELLNALGTDALASTQRNRSRGIGNLDPRAALMQKPAAMLSAAAFSWLGARLEAAFEASGRVTNEELATLDWPETRASHLSAHVHAN